MKGHGPCSNKIIRLNATHPVDMHRFLHIVVSKELARAHRLEHVSHDTGVVNDYEGWNERKKREVSGNV